MSAVDATRAALLGSGQLVDGGVEGVYHRSFSFERVLRGVEGHVSRAGAPECSRRLHLAPVQARTTLETSGYLRSFPQLVGVVSGLAGPPDALSTRDDLGEGSGGWTDELVALDLSLTSAACHGLYPLLAGTPLPVEGTQFEVQAWCFRHEPSPDPARMQSFRQHEFVFVGSPKGALAHRDRWRARGATLLTELGLELADVVANDPFFGRGGRLLAESQRSKSLKHELVAPVSGERHEALSSANYHEDHFGSAFGLRLADGEIAHTACVGFGLERITLALLRRHGLDVATWPATVTGLLGLEGTTGGEPGR